MKKSLVATAILAVLSLLAMTPASSFGVTCKSKGEVVDAQQGSIVFRTPDSKSATGSQVYFGCSERRAKQVRLFDEGEWKDWQVGVDTANVDDHYATLILRYTGSRACTAEQAHRFATYFRRYSVSLWSGKVRRAETDPLPPADIDQYQDPLNGCSA